MGSKVLAFQNIKHAKLFHQTTINTYLNCHSRSDY